MKTINTQMDKKHEKVWQLAIYVHLEFLKAPARVKEYKNALLRANEKEPSLLYIAAVERNCPLIARYISEIMYRVGFNPGEVSSINIHFSRCNLHRYKEEKTSFTLV